MASWHERVLYTIHVAPLVAGGCWYCTVGVLRRPPPAAQRGGRGSWLVVAPRRQAGGAGSRGRTTAPPPARDAAAGVITRRRTKQVVILLAILGAGRRRALATAAVSSFWPSNTAKLVELLSKFKHLIRTLMRSILLLLGEISREVPSHNKLNEAPYDEGSTSTDRKVRGVC